MPAALHYVLLVLILRSAHAEDVPQTRTRVRASRRMRTARGTPSCFETPRRSALEIWVRGRKARLLSMRAGRGRRILAKRTHLSCWPNEPKQSALLVLIQRSAHTEDVPQTRTRVRASRRMRTARGTPSCFETPRRSALKIWVS